MASREMFRLCVLVVPPLFLSCTMREKHRPEEAEAIAYLNEIRAPFSVNDRGQIVLVSLHGIKVPPDQAMERLEALRETGALAHVERFFATGTSLTDIGFKFLANWHVLRSIETKSAEITGHGLQEVLQRNPLTELEDLRPGLRSDTDVAMQRVASLPRLKQLNLVSSDLTDKGLQQLASSTSLEVLDITGTPTTGKAIRELRRVRTLRRLHAGSTGIDDDALQALATLPHLEYLAAYESRVTDAGAKHLSRFSRLRRLLIGGTSLTDEGTAHLRAIRSLVSLDLNGTNVTDACVNNLSEMKSLRLLRVDETRITAEGVARLRSALPECQVVDFRDIEDGDD